jgi:hypothetical protein
VALAGAMALVSGVTCVAAGLVQAGVPDRAAVEADPLRVHQRDRADGADQPAAQAVRLSIESTGRCATVGDRRRGRRGRGQPAAFAARRGTLAVLLLFGGSSASRWC